jgi:hypothetical protein
MHKTMILPVCLGILLVGIVMIPSSFAESAYTMSTYVHPEEKYSIQYPSTWLVEEWDDLLGWNAIFTDSEDWTIEVEIWELGSIPFIDIQSEQERFDGTIAGEKLGCTLAGDSMGYVCRDVEPTGEHGFVTLSSGEVVHSVSYTSVREYPEEHIVGITTTTVDFLCGTNHIYQIIFDIDTTNPANIPNETIFQIKQDMLESFTFLPAACDKTDVKASFVGYAIGTALALVILIGIPAIIIIVVVILIKRRKKTAQPTKQDLDDYESQYLRRQGQRPSPKPAEIRQTSAFCDSCGAKLKPTSKFCAKCGSPRS